MCTDRTHRLAPQQSQQGLTLIELVIFIVIVAAALAGVLAVLNVTTRSSADPMIRKQMLAIAEGVLEEVRMQPFTWCDPDDVNAATATSAAGCTGGVGGVNDQSATAPGTAATAPGTTAETRGNATTPFDNVADYNGAVIVTNIAGAALPAGYAAAVSIVPEALGPAAASVAVGAALRINVTVSYGADALVLSGYRARYAPNNLP